MSLQVDQGPALQRKLFEDNNIEEVDTEQSLSSIRDLKSASDRRMVTSVFVGSARSPETTHVRAQIEESSNLLWSNCLHNSFFCVNLAADWTVYAAEQSQDRNSEAKHVHQYGRSQEAILFYRECAKYVARRNRISSSRNVAS